MRSLGASCLPEHSKRRQVSAGAALNTTYCGPLHQVLEDLQDYPGGSQKHYACGATVTCAYAHFYLGNEESPRCNGGLQVEEFNNPLCEISAKPPDTSPQEKLFLHVDLIKFTLFLEERSAA